MCEKWRREEKEVRREAEENGFSIERKRDIPERNAVLWEMTHKETGARLLWLERDEENKTFAAAFRTVPEDDTGVFHILEHSLLCGSAKYPVSKPFVEMMKSSLQTFMNAFTFPDRTIYPVSSRNGKDFLNLMDVYLDAVLNPLCISEERIFQQEGWHYEMESPDAPPVYNGVVYNEMKGMYASPDTLIDSGLGRLLFPDTCYRFQAGGNPEHIPELTYEQYTAAYRRFYHPSNGWFLLDGKVDIPAVLGKIRNALRGFGRREPAAEIPLQSPVHPGVDRVAFEAGGENLSSRTILAKGWVYGRFDQPERTLACQALGELFCSSGEAPLKKAVLEKGLAENVEFSPMSGIQQPYAVLVIRNVTEGKEQEVWDCVDRTLRTLVKQGLDARNLRAILGRMEFREKERDSGGFPEGVQNCMRMLESSLYGGDAAQNLCLDQVAAELQKKAGEGYFEQFIREVLLENSHCAELQLTPSLEAGGEKRRQEQEQLQRRKESWSLEERNRIVQEGKALRQRQETPDSMEQTAALPRLALSDISGEAPSVPQTIAGEGDTTVLVHPLETGGILHLSYYFSLEDFTREELQVCSFMQTLFTQTGTRHYGALELRAELDLNLGRFQTGMDVFGRRGDTGACRPCFQVSISVLGEKLAEAARLTEEVLLGTDFGSLPYLYSRIRQLEMSMEQHVLMYGDHYASMRVAAGNSARGMAGEAIRGIAMLDWLRRMEERFSQEGELLVQTMERLRKRIFTKKRCVLSVTGNIPDQWLEKLTAFLPRGEEPGAAAVWPCGTAVREGICIPAETGFAAKGGHLGRYGIPYRGSMLLASRFLSYGYLWDTVRIKGGAYGTRLTVSPSGDVCFTSFRDPSPVASLHAFEGAGQALRGLCESREPLDRYIISAMASQEPLLSARQKGIRMAEDYLCGVTEEERKQEREEILHTTGKELLEISRVLDTVCREAGVCVMGGRGLLEGTPLETRELGNAK